MAPVTPLAKEPALVKGLAYRQGKGVGHGPIK